MPIAENITGVDIILEGHQNAGHMYFKPVHWSVVIDMGLHGWFMVKIDFAVTQPSSPYRDAPITKGSLQLRLTRLQENLCAVGSKPVQDQGTMRIRQKLLEQKSEILSLLENFGHKNTFAVETIIVEN
jgi:hypothetical protein